MSLRPDLYAVTMPEKHIDYWFIEMDLDTESPREVIEKCNRYHQYYMTQKEQLAHEVFPVVLWIVPTVARKERLIEEIKREYGNGFVKIFLVIAPNELYGTLANGADQKLLC